MEQVNINFFLRTEPVVVDTGDFKQYVNLRVSSEEATLQVIIPEDVSFFPLILCSLQSCHLKPIF